MSLSFVEWSRVGQAILPAAVFQPVLWLAYKADQPAGKPAAAKIGCPTLRRSRTVLLISHFFTRRDELWSSMAAAKRLFRSREGRLTIGRRLTTCATLRRSRTVPPECPIEKHAAPRESHSCLSAISGSTRDARHAGIRLASAATKMSSAETAAKVSGSAGVTP
jgi:hypothetical protein